MTDREKELLQACKKLIGAKALKSLRSSKNTFLFCWKRTNPANWYIENTKRPHQYLWHIWDGRRPNSEMFEKIPEDEIPPDIEIQDMLLPWQNRLIPEMSVYRLKPQYRLKERKR